MENQFNMTEQELKNIISEQKNIQSKPNKILIEYMDKLSSEFETTKEKIIQLTYHLDIVEDLYNKVLKEYQNRV